MNKKETRAYYYGIGIGSLLLPLIFLLFIIASIFYKEIALYILLIENGLLIISGIIALAMSEKAVKE